METFNFIDPNVPWIIRSRIIQSKVLFIISITFMLNYIRKHSIRINICVESKTKLKKKKKLCGIYNL